MRVPLGEKLFYLFNYMILLFAGLSCILPLVHLVALSFSSGDAILSGKVGLWPVEWTWISFKNLLQGTNIVVAFRNSVVLTVVGTVLSMLFTILAAYPLSKKYFYLRKPFTLAIVFTMLFPVGLIPNYLLMKGLGLVNTYGAIWLILLIKVYYMLILRTFFQNIPEELEEAARMDGCGEWRIILNIVMPLSVPVLVTLSLFYGVDQWNAFYHVLIYINDSNKFNLAVVVQNMIRSQSILQEMGQLNPEDFANVSSESIKAAGVIVMTLPMLAIYPFLQKYFMKGVMLGAVKG
ncbi:carbohydrate ABC transporter permease [Paenibacillus alkalitolerans]|uniref:carbohydrate ABC transporter permease n=1 Tax=Paenibacillus alkalitolerans TaxID=2799335 RepID=UPI0018F39B39|nr:carbohydrate ABC transporter permease [Paenibacillus alkalitolerans]